MKFALSVPDWVPHWRSHVPIVDVLAHYKRRDLSHDLFAGLVVSVITVPQAIAYAFLAGLPPQGRSVRERRAGAALCRARFVAGSVGGPGRGDRDHGRRSGARARAGIFGRVSRRDRDRSACSRRITLWLLR